MAEMSSPVPELPPAAMHPPGRRVSGRIVIGVFAVAVAISLACITFLWYRVHTGSHLPATSEDAVKSTLLTTRDAPRSLDPGDIQVEEGSGGGDEPLRIVSRVWTGTGSAAELTDFRYQFSNAEQAAAYLQANLSDLSEQSSGLQEVRNPPAVGQHTHVYTGSTQIQGSRVTYYNFVFSEGNIVAKVFLGGKGLSESAATAIAQNADSRITDMLANS